MSIKTQLNLDSDFSSTLDYVKAKREPKFLTEIKKEIKKNPKYFSELTNVVAPVELVIDYSIPKEQEKLRDELEGMLEKLREDEPTTLGDKQIDV